MVRLSPRGDDEAGAVAVLVACFALVMFGFAAMVVDLGVARDMRKEAQVIADTAALAAVGALDDPGGDRRDAFDTAERYVEENWPGGSTPDWTACDAATDGWQRLAADSTWCIVFAPTDEAVRVVIPRRDAPGLFGGLVGYSGMTVSAVAEARMTDQRVKRYRCALCVVDDSFDSDDDDDDNRNRNRNDNLTVDDGYVAVAGGDVRINGDLRLDRGTVSVNGGRARMTGRVTPSNRSSQVSPRAIEFERSSFGDPFDSSTFPMPSSSGPRKDEPCTDGPGVYEDRFTLDDDEICILPPGRYVIEDRWRIRDDARLTGSGVLLYFRDRGRLQIRDDAQVQLSALPTTVVVDRGNSQDLRVEDDAVLRVTGTIYAPRSDLLVYDDARAYLDSLVVVGDMHVEDGAVEVDYVRSLNHPFPEPMERLPGLQN